MMKKGIFINADLYPSIPKFGKKSAVKVSVPHEDKLIVSEEFQEALFAIKPRVCEPVVICL